METPNYYRELNDAKLDRRPVSHECAREIALRYATIIGPAADAIALGERIEINNMLAQLDISMMLCDHKAGKRELAALRNYVKAEF